MATIATVKYNDLRDTKNGQKRALKVEVPGVPEMVTIWLDTNQGEHFAKGDPIAVEQKGQYWNMSKDQPNAAPPAPPSQNAPAPMQANKGDMIAWGEQCADLYLHIFNKITLSQEFAAQPVELQKEACATIFIAAARRFERP